MNSIVRSKTQLALRRSLKVECIRLLIRQLHLIVRIIGNTVDNNAFFFLSFYQYDSPNFQKLKPLKIVKGTMKVEEIEWFLPVIFLPPCVCVCVPACFTLMMFRLIWSKRKQTF